MKKMTGVSLRFRCNPLPATGASGPLPATGVSDPPPERGASDPPPSDPPLATGASDPPPEAGVSDLPSESGARDLPPPSGVFYKTAPDKKCYDTINACTFCQKLVKQKMKRHLTLVHHRELEVQRASAGKREEQDSAFTILRNRGNFEHNQRVLREGRGELILSRRPNRPDIPICNFLPCPGCLVFLVKYDMPAHAAKCEHVTPGQNVTVAADVMLNQMKYGSDVPECVLKIRDPDVKAIVMSDPVLLTYAGYVVSSKGVGEMQTKVLKRRLTLLSKLLSGVRTLKKDDAITVTEMCTPALFDAVIEATMAIAGHDSGDSVSNPTFKIPTVAKHMGHALGKVTQIIIGRAIRNGDKSGELGATSFLRLRDAEWGDRITRAALHTLNVRTMDKDDALPTTEDMKILTQHLQKEVAEKTKKLQQADARSIKKAYDSLVKVLAVYILVFNKRRGGEAMKLKVTDYTERASYVHNETVLNSLSRVEQGMVHMMTLIKTLGKRGRVVPVLLPAIAKDGIETLLSARQDAGVPAENCVLFAKASGARLSAWHALKAQCQAAGVKNPALITATKMRKYLATVVQVLNLKENEMDMLASHLGHDLAVHRRYYRLQDCTIELGKIAHLLLSTEGELSRVNLEP